MLSFTGKFSHKNLFYSKLAGSSPTIDLNVDNNTLTKINNDLLQAVEFYQSQLGENIFLSSKAIKQTTTASVDNKSIPSQKTTATVNAAAAVADASASASGETKKKPAKQPKGKNSSNINVEKILKPIDITRLSLIVGKIVQVEKHPDADKLYVEKVDFGNGTLKTVVSGLVAHVPIEQMQDRVALFCTNLKPAKMRGILSEGMIMCASSSEKVEIINVPSGAKIGDKALCQGFGQNAESDSVLNPKEKILEQVLPLLKVNDDKVVCYDGKPLYIGDIKEQFTSNTLINVNVK